MGSKVRQIDEYVCAEMIKSDIELNYDKFYKDDLIRLLEACRKEYKKQKEVIDRIKGYIEPLITDKDDKECYPINFYVKDVLLSILKEVSE